ncbi:Hypothetical predicted protein [Paramuricea clavata]|uniref:Uncharacterized protein n=1 Tax=Paramuricea clavata TaxID=317549 RepID=A0A6S7KAZ0_PARCT|nr:Hypothetical predicted protein [Paramuricea clavata]
MNQARRKFYADFIEENKADQGQLFKAAKKLLGKKEELSFPDHFDKVSLANDIGRFFVRKIENIRSDINAVQFDLDVVPKDLVLNETQTFGDFQQLTEEDVTALVQKSGKKSCALDPMPTGLVVKCLGTLLPVLTRIINLSLASGKFSEEWKEALVVPLLKHQGLNLEFCNLRPISNLQYVSKLIERAVFEQMNNHMMQFGLYPVLQSAYRKGHSTETILLKIQNDILLNMDKQNVTLLVFLDLSAAFDTVDHDILISRLQSSFGIKGNVLNWFSSYLSNRTQRVTLSGCVSDSFSLEQGIPQGSCLGPLLFTIYARDAGDSLTFHNGMQFTTKDIDHDLHENNCAQLYKGGWWYNNCHESNLNGLYHCGGTHTSYADGINWSHWKGHHYSMKTVTMKIKEV